MLLLGKNVDQLVGKSDFDLFPADVAKAFKSHDEAMRAGRPAVTRNGWSIPMVGKSTSKP